MTEVLGAHSAAPTWSRLEHPLHIVILDGWTKSVFHRLLEAGDLPEISDVVRDGVLIPNVVSNLPSVSIASHASILTARYQDDHKIPGHRYFSEPDGRAVNYLRLRGHRNVLADLSPAVETVFERYEASPSYAIQSIVARGAGVTHRAPTLHPGRILSRTIAAVRQNPVSLAVTWLPGVDSLAHMYGPDSEPVLRDMRRTSKYLGQLAAELRRHRVYGDAELLLIPDHGHRLVHKRSNLRRELGAQGLKASMNGAPDASARLHVETSGDSAAYVYRRAATDDLTSLSSKLATLDSVELVATRIKRTELLFEDRDGVSLAELSDDLMQAAYRVIRGRDPLHILPLHHDSLGARLDLTVPLIGHGPYSDVVHQFSRSFIEGRSSPTLIFAKRETHFGEAPRLGWRLGYHRSTHGGPFSDEMLVSAIYKGQAAADPSLSYTPVRAADLLRRLGVMG